MLRRAVLALLLPLTAACGGSSGPVTVLKDTGSDAMLDLARAWASGFHRKDSQVEIAVTGGADIPLDVGRQGRFAGKGG